VFLADIPTPALVVDIAALDRNIRRMAGFFASGPCRLRPHVKAHKTPAIARRQLAAGSCVGLTCATIAEAEAVAELCDDLLLANEIVDADRCGRAAAIAARLRRRAGDRGSLCVAADSAAGIERLAAAARAADTEVGVLVDVDVGQHRCGVSSAGEARRLARAAAQAPGLRLRGVMGYEGHAQPIRDRAARQRSAGEAMTQLVAAVECLRADGLPCDIVSAGGTGTFDISGRFGGVTEIQAGSYVLMDADYAALDLPFEQAFWALGTVVSRPVPGRMVLDSGHKAVTRDHGLPGVHGVAGAVVTALNDEHAVVAIPEDAVVRVGDRVRLIPSHTDPTVNLHDVLYAIDGERVVDIWPVEARGYPEQRSRLST
jgi:D-serine deaminase-like pyridoxal phosphate-dependent protein